MSRPDEYALNDPTERDLVERLERYDEAQRSRPILSPSPTEPDGLPGAAGARLAQACAAIDLLRQVRAAPRPSPTQPQIAGYDVLDILGRGGMGVVYRARDVALNRPVALKVILAGAHAGAEELARFRAEAEAVARLDHPNIVRIYDVGQQEQNGTALPYMALELMEGGTLAERLDGKPAPLRPAAALVETLARAVEYAHQRGIIHRDLKPANILLQPAAADVGEWPLTAFVPKIADFGLAKRQEDLGNGHTATGAILGTAQYMAPEQAAGRNRQVGPATDIYALGTILYQLLTGRPPFGAEVAADILTQVIHQEPAPPRRQRPQIPRDLETICLKCLDKDPARRYTSAAALADDVRCYGEGLPIAARPLSAGGKLWRWARRRPVIASLSAALAGVTLLGIALVFWQWREAVASAQVATEKAIAEADARRDAESKTREVELLLLGAEIDRAITFCERGDLSLGLLSLARELPVAIRLENADLERVIRANLAAWRLHYSRQVARIQHDDWAWDVAFSPDGRFVATASKDGQVRVADARTGRVQGTPLAHPWPVWSVAFSPDSRRLLSGCGTEDGKQGEARLWDVATGALLAILPVGSRVEHAAFNATGERILTRGRGTAELWRVPVGGKVESAMPLAHPGRVTVTLFSPDGKTALTGGTDGTVRLWDTATARPGAAPQTFPGAVTTAAFRPDGRALAIGTGLIDGDRKVAEGEVHVWRLDTGKPVAPPLSFSGPLKSVAFSPDGTMLLAGAMTFKNGALGGEARLFDAQALTALGPVLPHRLPVWSVAFSPDGRTFLTGCEDRQVFHWMTATSAPIMPPVLTNGTVRTVAFSPDGRAFIHASASNTPQVQLWQAAQGQATTPPLYHNSPVNALALTVDGQRLLTGCADGNVCIWDVGTRKLVRRFKAADRDVLAVTVSPDGGTLASAGVDGLVRFWDVNTAQQTGELPRIHEISTCLCYSPDGQTLVTGRHLLKSGAQRWRMPAGDRLADLPHPEAVLAATFSADGRVLLTAGMAGVYRWDGSGGMLGTELVRGAEVHAIAISPDGKRFVSGSGRQTAQLWETNTGRRVGPSLLHQNLVRTAAFSRDGRLIVTGGDDRTARVWDAGTGKPLGAPLLHRERVNAAVFLPDGKTLAVASRDQSVQLWELPAPLTESPARIRAEMEILTGMQLDEHGNVRPRSAAE